MLLKYSGKSLTHGSIRKADENQRKQLKELLGYYVKISARCNAKVRESD